MNNSEINDDELFCDVCGMTYKEFLETGVFRCENCYRVFKTRTVKRAMELFKNDESKKLWFINQTDLNSPQSKMNSKKNTKKRIQALEKLLELAQKANDEEKIAKIKEEIAQLKNEIEY